MLVSLFLVVAFLHIAVLLIIRERLRILHPFVFESEAAWWAGANTFTGVQFAIGFLAFRRYRRTSLDPWTRRWCHVGFITTWTALLFAPGIVWHMLNGSW